MSKIGESRAIKKIIGKDEARRFLESLGFVIGGSVMVVSETAGNLIINVKNTRVAVSKTMANRIIVE
jgi:ferrous iron transport protein A